LEYLDIVCISDSHTRPFGDLPEANLLLFTGDGTSVGRIEEVTRLNKMFKEVSHRYDKIVMIPGNHDLLFERDRRLALEIMEDAEVLIDSGTNFEGFNIWGSPYTPRFMHWAFNADRGEDIQRHWDMIPDKTDILITHGPPKGILDQIKAGEEHLGCQQLMVTVDKIKPKLHAFGHIHGGYGQFKSADTLFVNSSLVTETYQPLNKAIKVTIFKD